MSIFSAMHVLRIFMHVNITLWCFPFYSTNIQTHLAAIYARSNFSFILYIKEKFRIVIYKMSNDDFVIKEVNYFWKPVVP